MPTVSIFFKAVASLWTYRPWRILLVVRLHISRLDNFINHRTAYSIIPAVVPKSKSFSSRPVVFGFTKKSSMPSSSLAAASQGFNNNTSAYTKQLVMQPSPKNNTTYSSSCFLLSLDLHLQNLLVLVPEHQTILNLHQTK